MPRVDAAALQTLVESYIIHARDHVGPSGKKRTMNTMSGYREAARKFADAVIAADLPLAELPPDFLHTHWLPLLAHKFNQPVHLRVRTYAVDDLLRWLHSQNIPVPPLLPVRVVQTTKTATAVPPVAEGEAMPQPILDPLVVTDENGQPVVDLPPMQAQVPQPVQQAAPPRAPVAPPVQPAGQVQPLAPKVAPKPVVPPKNNPLAHLLPSAGYKLRVRRERDLEEPVWVGDYPAEQVAVHGAIEPFLAKVAAGKMPGATGDVSFIVCPVDPSGREGERSRVTIAVSAAAPERVAAPVLGGAAPSGPSEIADLLAYHRRAQEELEQRIAGLLAAQQASTVAAIPPPPAPQVFVQPPQPVAQPQSPEVAEMRAMMMDMQRGMGLMAERLAELSNKPPEPPPPPVPQLDVLAVIDRVGTMMKATQAAQPPPQTALGGMAEMFSVMQHAKEIFAPQNVNVDVSPLEDQLKDVRAELAAVKNQAAKKDELLEFAEKAKALQSLFGGAGTIFGGNSSAAAPASSLGAALGNVLQRVLDNPEPIASAVERILNATARVKEAAVTQEIAKPPAPTPGAGLSPAVKRGIEGLLAAEGEGAIVTSAMELVQGLSGDPATKPIAEQIARRIQAGNEVELVAFLRQVFTRLGYGAVATPAKVQAIVTAVFKQIRAAEKLEAEQKAQAEAAAAPQAEEEFPAEEEQGEDLGFDVDDGQPQGATLNVRVGGTRGAQAEAAEDDGEYEEGEDGEYEEGEDDAEQADDEPVPVTRVGQAVPDPGSVVG